MNTDFPIPPPPTPLQLFAAIVLAYTGLIYNVGYSAFTRFAAMDEDQRIAFVVTYGITFCVCYYITSFMLKGNVLAKKLAILIAIVALLFTVANLFSSTATVVNLAISIGVNALIILLLVSRPVTAWFIATNNATK